MSEPPTTAPDAGREHAASIVLVHTGDGKGKTTAAMGMVLRAVARGWRVTVVQFIKSGDWRAGEEDVARSLGVDWSAIGDGFTWDSEDLSKAADVAREAWGAASQKIASGEFDLVVLDEVTYPMNWDWISTDDVVAAIRSRPEGVNVIATGRDAPAALIEIADTVTEMTKVRHAYDRGIAARRGIDF
ncbi:MAG TPA: cob(I)yrinic acid a,c-diamide adenosyltransferase [Actinomycetota bacterium]|nr:cob(I)yrinic acid a,c-diamide adenosyltransferase [Actinomycetota bacterium]